MGSFFDVHKAETSQQPLTTATPSSLDVLRAESSRQHVSDELWEDGLRDYLAHASSIMEKFSDVVNWLKENAAKGGPGAESSASDKKSSLETNKRNENNLSNEKAPSFASTSASFTTAAWPSTIFSNNQSYGVVSVSKNSGSLLSNSQSSGMFSGSQSLVLPPNTQTSGLLSSSSTGIFSNSKLGSLANNQSAGLFPKNQTQSSGLLSNSQGAGLFSNSQTPTIGSLSNSQGGNLFSSSSGPTLFSNSQSTGFFSSSPSSGLFSGSPSSVCYFTACQSVDAQYDIYCSFWISGGQNSATPNNNASDEADDGDELPKPDNPSVKKVEEKGVVVVYQVKCKLYVK
ncbi:unnamed protein product [Linum tenue]|uniref:Uncharacterized protein n=1 Tax=Linum tenue TaxID=586396 RepID=A0AAV0K044_9ROSI|nr:unnamed protein product [Linum tenue]